MRAFRETNGVTHKNSTISLATFAGSAALLLLTLFPVAPAQGRRASPAARKANSKARAEASNKAQKLFEEALGFAATRENARARSALLEAVTLWTGAGENERAARAALQVGALYERDLILDEALSCYTKAWGVVPPSAVKAIACRSIGDVYAKLYRRELASRYYEEAIKYAQMSGNKLAQMRALKGLAVLHYKMGEQSQALTLIRQAQELNLDESDEDARATLLHLIGRMNGPADERLKALEEALAIYQKRNDPEGQSLVLSSLSNLKYSPADNEQAIVLATRAKKLADELYGKTRFGAEKVRAREMRWRALLALARAQRAQGQNDQARRSYSLALADVEGISASVRLHTDYGLAIFREEVEAPCREMVDFLVERGEIPEAYNISQHVRATSMLSSIRARRRWGAPASASKDDQIRELSRKIASLRAKLAAPSISSKEAAKIEEELKNTELALDERRVKIEMNNQAGRQAYGEKANIGDLRNCVLADNESVLEFFLGENRSFAWLISRKSVFFAVLPERKKIEAEVASYLKLMAEEQGNQGIEQALIKHREAAGNLASILLGQLLPQLEPGRKLFVVPDGILGYCPLDTLVHNERYLIEDHEISYVPSAKLIEFRQDLPTHRTANGRMEFLGFGDPVFGLGTEQPGGNGFQKRENKAYREARGFDFSRLPRTSEEIKYIAKLFPFERRRFYLGKEATESHLKRESLSRFNIIHFATHSLIDEQNPSRSAVVLTLRGDPDEDGFLEAGEISELDLDCDLVVLSACQTGRGQLRSGEGILGLSRAFLCAGARSLVVSQWNVTDNTTERLMKSFYGNLAGDTGNAAAALRAAKLQILQAGGVTRHPHYWAPFIVVGAR